MTDTVARNTAIALTVVLATWLGACVDSELTAGPDATLLDSETPLDSEGDVPFDTEDVPDADDDVLPDTEDVPDTDDPDLPDSDEPDVPDTDDPDVPDVEDGSDVPDTDVPECNNNRDCRLLLEPDLCEEAVCRDGQCLLRPVEDCCLSDFDCEPLNGECTVAFCIEPGEACFVEDLCSCEDDRDCFDDAPDCTLGTCDGGVCGAIDIGACCDSNADCNDGNSCTADFCFDGQCVREDVDGPECCTNSPVIATTFSPSPAFRTENNTRVRWLLVETDLTVSPPAALYLGDVANRTIALGNGNIARATARFPIGPIDAGTDVEVRFQVFMDLRPGSAVDRLSVVLATNTREIPIFEKGEAGLLEWHSANRTVAMSDSFDAAWLEFRYDATQSNTDTNYLGVLVDDLVVRTGCGGNGGCETHDQCPDGPCFEGVCNPDGTCGIEVIVCEDDDDDPCTSAFCDPNTNSCQVEVRDCSDGDLCTTDACTPDGCVNPPLDCGDGEPCTDDTCDPDVGCLNSPTECDDGNPCTADSCQRGVGCVFVPIDNCCQPTTVTWDFEGANDEWVSSPLLMDFGWQFISAEGTTALYYGNANTLTFDLGQPHVASTTSGAFSLPQNAAEIRFTMNYLLGLDDDGNSERILLALLNGDGAVSEFLWRTEAGSPPQYGRSTRHDHSSRRRWRWPPPALSLRWLR